MKQDNAAKKSLHIRGEIIRFVAVPLVLFLALTILAPSTFLSAKNIRSMEFQMVELGLVSIAMMFAFIAGSIDLSIAAIANCSAMVCALIFKAFQARGLADDRYAWVIVLCLVTAMATGVLCGVFNGIIIARIRLSPMLATLGSMYLFSGIVYVITKGKSIAGFPEQVADFGNGATLGIANTFYILVVVALVAAVILNKTRFGKELRYFGTNQKASLFSGINISGIILKTFILTGLIAGVTGFEYVIKTNTAKADYGDSYVFTSILCICLGNVSPSGGKGGVFGVMCGLVSLQLLSSGFSILGLGSSLKNFLWGVLLLGVMVMNFYIEQREIRNKSAKK